LSLFRANEIEMLVRGDDNDLDLAGLESITVYEGFDIDEQIVRDLWNLVNEKYSQEQKKKFLTFITGTDRVCAMKSNEKVPATGIQNMRFKLTCLGPDSDNLPLAHTFVFSA
jgi:hypothetical protein